MLRGIIVTPVAAVNFFHLENVRPPLARNELLSDEVLRLCQYLFQPVQVSSDVQTVHERMMDFD